MFIPVVQSSLLQLKQCHGVCVDPANTDNIYSSDQCGRRSPGVSCVEDRSSPAVVLGEFLDGAGNECDSKSSDTPDRT